jgi:hypothetical protein
MASSVAPSAGGDAAAAAGGEAVAVPVKPGTETKKALPPVSYLSLFRFADSFDIFLYVIGVIGCIGNGIVFPLFTLCVCQASPLRCPSPSPALPPLSGDDAAGSPRQRTPLSGDDAAGS